MSILVLTSDTLIGTAAAGNTEYDGVCFYPTADTTGGRAFSPNSQIFRLTANGAPIGATIDNYFGTSSSITLSAAGVYEIEYFVYFLKNTAGTVTFTLTAAQTPVNVNAYYVGTPVAGVTAVGTAQTAAIVTSASTATVLPATGSLANSANHQYYIKAIVQGNATVAGTFKLQVTESVGSITPLLGSYYKVTRIPVANTGTFA